VFIFRNETIKSTPERLNRCRESTINAATHGQFIAAR